MQTARAITVYPAAPGLTPSTDVAVRVNGQPIWTEHLHRPCPEDAEEWFAAFAATHPLAVHTATFACDGPHTVTITRPAPIASLTVRPKSLQIPVTLDGECATLQLPGPCKLLIEIDDLPPLLLFADPLEVDAPAADDPEVLYFGPGEHHPGLITLKDRMQVYFAPGAVVYGGFRGHGAHVRIFGRGILDGRELDTPMVILDGAADVSFSDITLRCGRGWQNTLRNCEHIRYRNVKVLSFVPFGDGIDPVCSRDIHIENSFFRCSDDCMAVKAFKSGPIVSGITVTGCVMAGYAFGDGFTIGFEADTALMENITVRDCDILSALGPNKAEGHSAFSVICDGPAVVRNVVFENIRVEEDVFKLFELHVTDGDTYVHRGPGRIHDVLVKDVTWAVDHPIILHGDSADHGVDNVIFENCLVAGVPLTSPAQVRMNAFVENVRMTGKYASH